MIGISLCVIAFLISFFTARRSLIIGILATIGIGYSYGIVRANWLETFSHFIFDAAVLGLYIQVAQQQLNTTENLQIKKWLLFLIGWPIILFFIPIQDYSIQLVGLRGNIFLLPFLLIGARLKDNEIEKLSLGIAVLNICAFGFAAAEYFIGVDYFFPQNAVTTIIYNSNDVAEYTAFRIPACFVNAHAYSGTMVITLPFLFGLLAYKQNSIFKKYLIFVSIGVSTLGIFMAAARTPVIVLAVLLGTLLISLRFKKFSAGIFLVLGLVTLFIINDSRLQRFSTLNDTKFVTDRIYGSTNEGFFDLMFNYPMGNGLGGGGTSIPYFLQEKLHNPNAIIENEYGRILLEQGMVGLIIWIGFIYWAIMRKLSNVTNDSWLIGRKLSRAAYAMFFLTGLTGIGSFTSIPQTSIFLLSIGWVTTSISKSEIN